MTDKALIAQLKEALTLARQALETTETHFMSDQFDLEEKALVAIDFALEKIRCGLFQNIHQHRGLLNKSKNTQSNSATKLAMPCFKETRCLKN